MIESLTKLLFEEDFSPSILPKELIGLFESSKESEQKKKEVKSEIINKLFDLKLNSSKCKKLISKSISKRSVETFNLIFKKMGKKLEAKELTKLLQEAKKYHTFEIFKTLSVELKKIKPKPLQFFKNLIDLFTVTLLETENECQEKYALEAVRNLDRLEISTFVDDLALVHHAILKRNRKVVLLMLNKGGDPNIATSSGITPLHLAVFRNFKEIVSLLLSKKANPHLRDYTGSTPLNLSLNYLNTLSIGKKIILKTGSKNVNPFYLYDSFKQLNLKFLADEVQLLLAFDPCIKDLWKEFYLTKLCAHFFDMGGHSLLKIKNSSRDSMEYTLDGLTSPRLLLQKIYGYSCRLFQKKRQNESLEALLSFCKFAAEDHLNSHLDYLTRILADEPTLVMTSSWYHCYYFLFYEDKFVICDGNLDSFIIWNYNKKKLNEETIKKLRKFCSYATSRSRAEKLRQDIMEALEANKVSEITPLNWSKQSSGACTLKSFEASVRMLKEFEVIKEEFEISGWLGELKILLVSKYVLSHLENKSKCELDKFFLYRLVTALSLEREENLSIILCEKIDRLLEQSKTLLQDQSHEEGGLPLLHEREYSLVSSHWIVMDCYKNPHLLSYPKIYPFH